MGVSINVNTSPFAGKEGEKLTLNDLKLRLLEEAENDVALEVNIGNKNSTSIMVKGRGDL
jgi:GTP-binding protein